MIGKLIGAFAGSKLADNTRASIGGPTGAALGVAAATVAKRLSLPALVAITAGGYFAKKYFDQREDTASDTGTQKPVPEVKPSAT